jgi:hypothetical protein
MRKTCGDCPHLKHMDMMSCPVFFCGKTDLVIPQNTDGARGVATFHRVPIECPLPDTEVAKSSKPVAKKDITTRSAPDWELKKSQKPVKPQR